MVVCNMDIFIFIAIGFGSFVFSLIFTPWVAIVAKKWGAVQEPPEKTLEKIIRLKKDNKITDAEYEAKLMAARRRPDKKSIIQWGGVAYVVPFLIVSGGILLFSKTINIPVSGFSTYIIWLITIVVLFVMGVLDDKFEFSGKVQFIFYIFATIVLMFSKVDITGFHNPITSEFISLNLWQYKTVLGNLPISLLLPGDILLFLWLLPLMMGLKVQGGSDGLMEGNVFWGSIFLFISSFIYGQITAALFSIVLAGAMLGFLFYNFYPHKIISGSAGKSVIGFILGGIAIIDSSKFAISLIVFAIPLIDLFWVYLRRISYYKPKSLRQLFKISDRFHFHHRLMKLGYSEVQIALFEYALTVFFGTLAIILPSYKTVVLAVTWITIATIIIYTTQKSNEA